MLRSAAVLTILFLTAPAMAQATVDPRGHSILFLRGAYGSGGATEGGTPAQRTEQLSDITNTTTNKGNHGYGSLRALLTNDGFVPNQVVESNTSLTLSQLLKHRIVVFGSNNKVYTAAEVRAFHTYIDRGGSALFISDANWGLTWEKAPASDNQFLARYGALVYQDSGFIPTMARETSGRYLVADHPVLSGPDGVGETSDVNNYNGEGVSLFRITTGSNGYQAARMVAATGLKVRLNTTTGKAGATRAATANDAAMIFVEKGQSRTLQFLLTRATPSTPGWLIFAPGLPRPALFPNNCTTYVDLTTAQVLTNFTTDATGSWTARVPLPGLHILSLSGAQETLQALTFISRGPFLNGGELSNASTITLGYPR